MTGISLKLQSTDKRSAMLANFRATKRWWHKHMLTTEHQTFLPFTSNQTLRPVDSCPLLGRGWNPAKHDCSCEQIVDEHTDSMFKLHKPCCSFSTDLGTLEGFGIRPECGFQIREGHTRCGIISIVCCWAVMWGVCVWDLIQMHEHSLLELIHKPHANEIISHTFYL